jgi:ubiquinone biosynthesis protein COQ4
VDNAPLTNLATDQAAAAGANPSGPRLPRVPSPGPDTDVRPRVGGDKTHQLYMQGDKLPQTSSVLISNSKYLNNPIYRDAYVTQALRRHGHDLPPTYMVPLMMRAFEETTDYRRLGQLLAEEKNKNPVLGAWLDERRQSSYRRDDMEKYEPGTLGHEIWKFLGTGFDMEFAGKQRADMSDVEYLFVRRGSLHDIEHMLTGFAPNAAGENALSMMNVAADANYFTPELAQMFSQANVWITSTGYNRAALHYHHALPTYLNAMQQGIAAGLALQHPLFLNQWEDFLDWQLEDIATHLGFKRGPGAAWDWTTDATNG